MPLIKSRTQTAWKKNVEKEIKSGKSIKQAMAIAYSIKNNKRSGVYDN